MVRYVHLNCIWIVIHRDAGCSQTSSFMIFSLVFHQNPWTLDIHIILQEKKWVSKNAYNYKDIFIPNTTTNLLFVHVY